MEAHECENVWFSHVSQGQTWQHNIDGNKRSAKRIGLMVATTPIHLDMYICTNYQVFALPLQNEKEDKPNI
jgi:hypothetical protein